MYGKKVRGKGLAISLAMLLLFTTTGWTAGPIILGVPTSTGFIEGNESLKAVKMAAEEINAQGGVKVGTEKLPLKVESLDIRDAAPGVPVPEALLGIEKMILERKPTALLVGPFRSEALMASMDIIAKYKIPMLGTIAMSPASEAKIKANPDKYKYIFRVCLDAKYLVKYLAGTMAHINKQFGFNKVFILNQDVAWARATANIMKKVYFSKAGWQVVGEQSFPTGTTDFSSALMKVRAKGAQVILPIFDMPQSGILVKQWNAMKVPALLAGFISPLAGPGAWETFDKKIAGAINCNFEMGSAIASAKIPRSVAFEKAYRRRWGKVLQAGHGPAPAYESVYILADAIQRAGSLNADAITAELEKANLNGVMGHIAFDKGHQVVYGMDPAMTAVAAVSQWQADGSRKIVFPPALAEAKIKLPPGLTAVK
jgi:branched-chain amino acid transport system substrate-binding protein